MLKTLKAKPSTL